MQALFKRDLSDENNAAPFKSSPLYPVPIQVAALLSTQEAVQNNPNQYCVSVLFNICPL